MLAQAQECLFEKMALPGIRNQFYSLMKMAQEAAKVSSSKAAHMHETRFLLLHLKWMQSDDVTTSIILSLPGVRNLRPSPSEHDPDASKRQRPVFLVHHVANQNQPLPLHGTLLCSFSTAGPPV